MFDWMSSSEDDLAVGAPSQLATLAAGPDLALLLDYRQPRGLSGYDLVDYLGAARRLVSWAESIELHAIAELAGRRPPAGGPAVLVGDMGDAPDEIPPGGSDGGRPLREIVSEFATDEVAAELRCSRAAAESRLALAVLLERLPGTRLALAAGRIDMSKARAIVDATTSLSDAEARLVEDRVLPRAAFQTGPGLRQSLRRAVLRINPAAAQVRHERAVRERGVELVALEDGMAQVIATMPATDAMGFFTWVTARADKAKSPGDRRTLNQRRSDVLAGVAFHGLAAEDLPTRKGRRPHLQVTVSASTLLGLDEAPGELAGYGPITPDVARRVATDATWRRLLTDPASGALLDYGRTTHDPPQALADHVIARDQTCTGIGCRQPARRCDLDHTVPFPQGPTAHHNVSCRCKHCHRLKHETTWSVEQHPDGSQTWTSPTGHCYTRPAIPVLEPG